MSKITVLGGCGGIGTWASRTVASREFFDEVVIADFREDAACALADGLGDKVTGTHVDANDIESVKALIAGSDIVLNCIGPYYRYGPPILQAVIESGIDYVDVCDDLDATEKMLAMDGAAREAGVSALIGIGNSPGLANVLVRFCAETLLDEAESVDIYHVHGGEPAEGGAVIKHRIHAMTSDIPLFIDGEFMSVRMLEESGQTFAEKEVEFKGVGTYPAYPYPHPETITLPRYLPALKRVTNNGSVLPVSYFNLTMDVVRLGIASEEPIEVQGKSVVPLEFGVAFIISQRPRLLAEAGVTEQQGCLKVVVKGTKDGESHTYVFSMFSTGAAAGEGTGIPGGIGAILMSEGKIERKGVFPPEAAVVPLQLIEIAGQVVQDLGVGGGGADRVPIYIEHIDAAGNREEIDLKL
ncbi:MAG: saccharopine dehydrogenase NADP-binding domain-containing protein [Actinobacteria bacterium]|nr:saccharopine dehydrogenase NADP-binding domain-containing protein [Actinomycetota bacterium]MBU1943978.1 saccharopine dehydrogenase NADP-binding domain-containing protein [Actinomycetota bacterium]MBU2686934.1 saccharopine dehydrogenase NADP-binding domain-containing protein [Actinomycetota bacterium]